MKTRKQYYACLALSLLAGCFQNLDFANSGNTPATVVEEIKEVNEQIRVSHARELLGKYYQNHMVKKSENLKDLHIEIFNSLTKRLPKKYKNQALYITRALISESQKYGFDPVFVMAVIATESQFNPLARGQFGEIGLMQLKPDTAGWIAEKYNLSYINKKTLENPISNIRLGVAYFSYLRDSFKGSAGKYVSAYNVGPNKLRRMIANNQPPKDYAQKVMGNYKEFYTKMTEM